MFSDPLFISLLLFAVLLTLLLSGAWIGFSLFVIQGISYESAGTIIKATIPFFLLMILTVVLIALWPDIVMLLPNHMNR